MDGQEEWKMFLVVRIVLFHMVRSVFECVCESMIVFNEGNGTRK